MKVSGFQASQVFNQFPSASNLNRNYASNVNFTNDAPEETEGKKKKFTFKRATNIIGVLAWIGLVAYGSKTLGLFNKTGAQAAERNIDPVRKRAKSVLEDVETKIKGDDPLASLSAPRKMFAKLGNWVQNNNLKFGKELWNNLIYAFGTLLVMPAVVLSSPMKTDDKKDGWVDKIFTILRQPLSVAATLTMQFTFDKLLGKKIPQVIKENHLENKDLLDKDGKFKTPADAKDYVKRLGDIKYNDEEAEAVFKKLLDVDVKDGGLKGIFTSEEVGKIFDKENLKSFEEKDAGFIEKKFYELFKQKFPKVAEKEGELPLSAKKLFGLLDKDLPKFDVLTNANIQEDILKGAMTDDAKSAAKNIKKLIDVFNRKEIITTKTKVGVNVLLAAPIACTFLNVIYGKTMKGLKKPVENLVGKCVDDSANTNNADKKEVK